MITKGTCNASAAPMIADLVGEPVAEGAELQMEFREVPYFVVSRSHKTWDFERGDINALRVVGANDRGLVVDPQVDPADGRRRSLIPWTNVLSLTVSCSGA